MKLKPKDIVFVVIQCILFVVYCLNIRCFIFNSPAFISYIAIGLTVIGALITATSLLLLNKNLSPFPSPKTNSILITHGLYNYMRHPIYTGIILSFFGYGLYVSDSFKIIISILLLILFYFKSGYEEQELTKKFTNYKFYKKTTGRFFPKI